MTEVSLDEFGQDLFAAIKAQSGMRQAERTANLFKKKGVKRMAKEYELRAQVLQRELSAILAKNTIAPADLKRLLAIK